MLRLDDRVVFCTGGAGTICSAQVRALVHLGANACIVGRNVEKTEGMARDIATARKGAKVLGIGAVDVRRVESLQKAVEKCVSALGGIDYVMYVFLFVCYPGLFQILGVLLIGLQCRCSRQFPCPDQPAQRQRIQIRHRHRCPGLVQHRQSHDTRTRQISGSNENQL